MKYNLGFKIGGLIDSLGRQYFFSAEEAVSSLQTVPLSHSIISFSSFDSVLDIHSPVATTGGGSIVLPRRVYGAGGLWVQLDEIFGGVLPERTAARLTGSISSTQTTFTAEGTVENGYYHLGTECVLVSGSTITRGQAGTYAQPHYANAELSQYPVLSTFPYAWNSRPIIIYLNNKIWRVGYLTGVPVIGDETITLSWVPLEARVSDTPPNALVSPLAHLHSAHYISVPLHIPQMVIVNNEVAMGQYNTANNTYSIYTDTPYYQQFDNLVMVPTNRIPDYTLEGKAGSLTGLRVFDYDNPSRFGYIKLGTKVNDTSYILEIYGLSGISGTINLAVAGGGSFFITPAIGTVGSTISVWDLFTALNAYNSARPDGAVHSVYYYDPIASLVTTNGGVFEIASRAGNYQTIPFIDYGPEPNTLNKSLYWGLIWSETTPDYWTENDSLYDAIHEAENFYYFKKDCCDISYAEGDIRSGLKDEYSNWRERIRDGYWNSSAPFIARYPIRCATGEIDITAGQTNIKSHVTFNTWKFPASTYGNSSVNILYASRWWELGERYICLDNTLGTGTFTAQCSWREPHCSNTLECNLTFTYVDYNSNYGYRYEVKPDFSSVVPAGIGDWTGYRASFQRAPITPYRSDDQNILDLLTTVDGQGGTFSTVSAGLGIPESQIDLTSFERNSCYQLGVQTCSMDLTDSSVTDEISPYLFLSCTAIAGKFTGTNYKLFRVPLSPPCLDDVVLQINDNDIIGTPTSSMEYNIATNYKITVHIPGHTGAAPKDVDYYATDVDACQIFGQGLTLEIDLRGAVFDWSMNIEDVIKSALARMVDTYGKPQRLWQITLPFDIGYKLNVGDVVSLSSDWVYGKTVGRGVTDELGRIISTTQDYLGGTTTIQVLVAWKESAGYAPSFQYFREGNSSFSAMEIPFHQQTDPTGALHDVDYFRVGATVRCWYNTNSSKTYTIASITKNYTSSTDRITLSTSCSYYRRPLVFEQVTTYDEAPKTTHQFILGTSYVI